MECAQLKRFLEMNALEAARLETADLVIFYSCGLTQLDAHISIDLIDVLESQRKPGSEFIVWGCLPKIDPALVASTHYGFAFGRRETDKLEAMIGAKIKYNDVKVNHLFHDDGQDLKRIRAKYQPDPLTYALEELNCQLRSVALTGSDVFCVMTARGCLSKCKYCSDCHSSGRLTSKPVDRVLDEFRDGLHRGFKRFHLVSTDLGVYGRDLGYTLVHLLETITGVDGQYELLLPNINPRYLKDMLGGLLPILQSGKVTLLGTSMQSGSNKILRAMGRGHTIDEFKKCVAAMKEVSPKLRIWTQTQIGFPGETEEDFDATLRVVDELPFDYVQVFKFSRRPTTPASYYANQVPETVLLHRYRILLAKAIYKEVCDVKNGRLYLSPGSVPVEQALTETPVASLSTHGVRDSPLS